MGPRRVRGWSALSTPRFAPGTLPQVIWIQTAVVNEFFYKSAAGTRPAAHRGSSRRQRADRGHLPGAPAPSRSGFHPRVPRRRAEARSEIETALAMLDVSRNRDVQFQAYTLNSATSAFAILGDFRRASELLERLIVIDEDVGGRAHFAPPFHADFTAAVARCGFGERYLAAFADASSHPRLEAGRLMWSWLGRRGSRDLRGGLAAGGGGRTRARRRAARRAGSDGRGGRSARARSRVLLRRGRSRARRAG